MNGKVSRLPAHVLIVTEKTLQDFREITEQANLLDTGLSAVLGPALHKDKTLDQLVSIGFIMGWHAHQRKNE